MKRIRIAKQEKETLREKVHRIRYNTQADISEFYQEHKIGIYIASTMIISGTAMAVDIAKTVMRRHDMKMQDLRIYDRSLDIWWDLRKKLTANQKLVINDRMKQGERLGDILRDLNMLK